MSRPWNLCNVVTLRISVFYFLSLSAHEKKSILCWTWSGVDLEELEQLPEATAAEFLTELRSFIAALPFQYILDNGKLVDAHAGLPEEYHGIVSEDAQNFAIRGSRRRPDMAHSEKADEPIASEILPSRASWVLDYSGSLYIVYGHTPVYVASWKITRSVLIRVAYTA